MSSVSKAIGKGFQAVGSFSGNFYRALGLDSVAAFSEDFIGGQIGGIFNPLPPEINVKDFRRDLQLSGSSEGTDLPIILGQNARVSGALVWIGNVKKQVVEPSGGKGGGADFSAPKSITRADCIYLVSSNPIERIREVRGGGFLVWRQDDVLSITNDDITAVASTFSGGKPKLTLSALFTDANLKFFKTGKDITLSGFANTGNNGVWRVTKSSYFPKTKMTQIVLKDIEDTKTPSDEAAGALVTLEQPLPDVQKATKDAQTMTGEQTQTAITEVDEFQEHAPAYRGRGGMFFKGLNTLKVGSLLNMTFFVDERLTQLTLQDCVDEIMSRKTDLTSSEWDASALSGNLENFVIPGGTAEEALLVLSVAFDFEWRDEEGVLTFFHRGSLSSTTISVAEIGVKVDGQDLETGRPLDVRQNTVELSSLVTVGFTDINNDMLTGTASQPRFGTDYVKERRVDLQGIGMSADEARKIAKRELHREEGERLAARVALPVSRIGLAYGDTVNVPIDGTIYPSRVGRKEETDDFLVLLDTNKLMDAVPYPAPSLTQFPGQDGIVAELDVHAWTRSALVYDHLDKPGFYLAACRTDDGVAWEGAVLFKRLPTGEEGEYEWAPVQQVLEEAVVGFFVAEDSLYYDDGAGLWHDPDTGLTNLDYGVPYQGLWDNLTELVVELHNDDATLSSATDQEVLNGSNRLMWHKEIIAFVNAESLGDRRFKLTRFLRNIRDSAGFDNELNFGLQGTPDHQPFERVVLLTGPGIVFREETLSVFSAPQSYKLVPENGEIDDVETLTVDFAVPGLPGALGTETKLFGTLTPFTPYSAEVSPFYAGGVDDIVITPIRRTRAITDVLSGAETPLLEESERYEIYVIGTSGSPDGRMFDTGDIAPGGDISVTYTAAQQSADGWSGSTLNIFVRQHSESVGPGPYKYLRVFQGYVFT